MKSKLKSLNSQITALAPDNGNTLQALVNRIQQFQTEYFCTTAERQQEISENLLASLTEWSKQLGEKIHAKMTTQEIIDSVNLTRSETERLGIRNMEPATLEKTTYAIGNLFFCCLREMQRTNMVRFTEKRDNLRKAAAETKEANAKDAVVEKIRKKRPAKLEDPKTKLIRAIDNQKQCSDLFSTLSELDEKTLEGIRTVITTDPTQDLTKLIKLDVKQLKKLSIQLIMGV